MNLTVFSNFVQSGRVERSRTGRSFKVYAILNGKEVFVGLVSKRDLEVLLNGEYRRKPIKKFVEGAEIEQPKKPLDFSLKLSAESKSAEGGI
jgi:hypothetical protein